MNVYNGFFVACPACGLKKSVFMRFVRPEGERLGKEWRGVCPVGHPVSLMVMTAKSEEDITPSGLAAVSAAQLCKAEVLLKRVEG